MNRMIDCTIGTAMALMLWGCNGDSTISAPKGHESRPQTVETVSTPDTTGLFAGADATAQDAAIAALGYRLRLDYVIQYEEISTEPGVSTRVTLVPYERHDDSCEAIYLTIVSRGERSAAGSFRLRTTPSIAQTVSYEFIEELSVWVGPGLSAPASNVRKGIRPLVSPALCWKCVGKCWLKATAAGCTTAAVACGFSGPAWGHCAGGWCAGAAAGAAVGCLLDEVIS